MANTPVPKKKGLIRWGAVAPFTIFIALVWLYFALFFDSNLRHAIEHFGTNANGAEVDVGHLHTSFWSASLDIGNIEVTSVEDPTKNKIQIGSIKWKMLWDALLRGKVAINEAAITDIMVGSTRKHPGRVLPPPPPPPPNQESQFDKLKQQTLDNAQKEFSQNILGDVAGFLKGGDAGDQLKIAEGSLKSKARIEALQKELDGKQKEWNDRLSKLPQQKDFQALQDRIKTVKTSGFNNPQEVQQSIQQLNDILKDANSKFGEVKATSDALNGDLNKYQGAYKEVDGLVQQDIKDLEGRLKIPKIDTESLSKMLFGPKLLARVKQAEFYMNKARQYMPAKKSADAKAAPPTPVAHERSKGKTYAFGRLHAYPLFWLKLAKITSKSSGAEYSGDLEGQITDLTTDQPIVGKPTVATFKGDFPKQQIFKVDGEVIIDHVTDVAKESVSLTVGQFPVAHQMLVDSNDVHLGFDKADGATTLKVELQDNNVSINSNSAFQNIAYQATAQPPLLGEMIKNIVTDVPKVTVDAKAAGSWTDLKFNVDTNLARELQKGFEKQLQLKIAEAKAKVQKLIDEQIAPEKAKLTAQYNKIQDQVKGALKSKEDEANKAKSSVDSAKDSATKGQQKQLEQKGKDLLNDAKKRFGF